jgi:hypothetical protein
MRRRFAIVIGRRRTLARRYNFLARESGRRFDLTWTELGKESRLSHFATRMLQRLLKHHCWFSTPPQSACRDIERISQRVKLRIALALYVMASSRSGFL